MRHAIDITTYLPQMKRYAISLTRNGEDAQDLVQDTCLRALDKQHLFRPDTNLRAWLFTIMHNLFISGRRRARFAPVVDLDAMAELVSSAPDPFEQLAARDLIDVIYSLPGHKAWLIEKHMQGHDYEALAAATGKPIGTIKSRLSRSRKLAQGSL
jgi:RNA polymerase sigma-70 factor (ECF subfamily)